MKEKEVSSPSSADQIQNGPRERRAEIWNSESDLQKQDNTDHPDFWDFGEMTPIVLIKFTKTAKIHKCIQPNQYPS